VLEEHPLPVEAHHLAPGPEPGINSEHVLPAERWREEQFAQVGCEDADGFGIRALLGLQAHLRLDGRFEQPPIPVLDGQPHLLRCRAAILEEHAAEQRDGVFLGRQPPAGENPLGFAAPDGENPV